MHAALRNTAIAAAFAMTTSGAAFAAPTPCSPMVTQEDRQTQARAQATVDVILRNGFGPQGFEEVGFNLVVELPPEVAPNCPPSRESVFNLRKLENGQLSGQVAINFLSQNSALFLQEITFAPEAIIDWSFQDLNAFPVVQYGLYAERPVTQDGRILYGLTDADLPEGWD